MYIESLIRGDDRIQQLEEFVSKPYSPLFR